MRREDFIKLIISIEEKYDTNLFVINGVSFWPMMRMAIFGIYHNVHNVKRKGQLPKMSNSKWTYLSRFILLPITSLKLLYIRLAKKRIETLFIGDISEHVDVNGESVNRFLYVFMQNHKSNLENYSYLDTRKMRLPIGPIDIDIKGLILTRILILKYIRTLSLSSETNEMIKTICEEVADKIALDSSFIENTVRNSLNSTIAAESVFSNLIKLVKPKKVVSVSYYGTEIYGLFIASRKAGIPTVDIQHGAQGVLHLAYSNFTKIPKCGYDMLPKYFWVWDEQSENDIDSWSKDQDFHHVIRGGQPWLSAQLKNREKRSNEVPVILFTMQFPELSQLEQALINQTSQDFCWYLKAHPTWENNLGELTAQISGLPFSDKVILLPPKSPLLDHLYDADIHISRYSGSIIEASLLGTYSVIIDSVGIGTFQNIIESKRAFPFIEEDADFLSLAKNILKLPKLSSTVLDLDEIYKLYKRI